MKLYSFDPTAFLKSLFIIALSFLSPIYGIISLLSMAVFADTIFAIYATIKLNGINSFQSNKLFNLAIKTFFYMGSLLLAFTIDTVIVSSNTMFVEIIPNAWIWYGKRWVKLEGLALKSLLEFFIRLDLTKIVTELLTKCWIAIVAMLMTSAPSLLGKRLIYLSKEKSSVTRWLDYFSIFGRLKQLKFTQRAQLFVKVG